MKRFMSVFIVFAVCGTFFAETASTKESYGNTEYAANELVIRNVADTPSLEEIASTTGSLQPYFALCCPECGGEANQLFDIILSPIVQALGKDKVKELFIRGVYDGTAKIKGMKNPKKRCPKVLGHFQSMCQKGGLECPNVKAALR